MSALPGVIDVRDDAGSVRVGDVRDLATRVGAQPQLLQARLP